MCLAICYRKNESVLRVRRVMRHLVIQTDSCGRMSPGVMSWLLLHSKESAHTPLIVLNFLANNNTVFTRLDPLRLFLFPKLKRFTKGRRFTSKKDFAVRAQDHTKKCLSEVLRKLAKAVAQVYYILSLGRG